jgi:hypothetical protein
MPGTKTDELVKTLLIGMLWEMCPIVPLAKAACAVSCVSKYLSDRHFPGVHVLFTLAHPGCACSQVVTTREKAGPGWRTKRTDIEPLKMSAVFSHSIDGWCAQSGISMYAKITPSLVIGQNKDDIGVLKTVFIVSLLE